MKKNTHTFTPEELRESLRTLTFLHPIQGKFSFENLFNAHSGFVCLMPLLEPSLLDTLKDEKKELDSLGLQLIVITGKSHEDNDILIINEPDLLKNHSIDENEFFFIEEGWKKCFFVSAPDEFLPTAADYIILDSEASKHLTEKMKTILKNKGISFEENNKCCNCATCPKDHIGL
ncbi:MAG: hypothetical protein AB2L14_00280 [Candidatus Xenobiia bacterium LiM19]